MPLENLAVITPDIEKKIQSGLKALSPLISLVVNDSRFAHRFVLAVAAENRDEIQKMTAEAGLQVDSFAVTSKTLSSEELAATEEPPEGGEFHHGGGGGGGGTGQYCFTLFGLIRICINVTVSCVG
jgi:hypothetical protein